MLHPGTSWNNGKLHRALKRVQPEYKIFVGLSTNEKNVYVHVISMDPGRPGMDGEQFAMLCLKQRKSIYIFA